MDFIFASSLFKWSSYYSPRFSFYLDYFSLMNPHGHNFIRYFGNFLFQEFISVSKCSAFSNGSYGLHLSSIFCVAKCVRCALHLHFNSTTEQLSTTRKISRCFFSPQKCVIIALNRQTLYSLLWDTHFRGFGFIFL